MKFELKLGFIVLISLALAIPISFALKHRTGLLNIEKTQNSSLQLQIKSKDKLLQDKDAQLQQQKQQNIELQKQLQAKKEAAAKLAAAKALEASYTTPNCEAYRPYVSQYDWDVSVAMAVMKAESGCRAITPDNAAANYDGISDYGLFQLHGINVIDPAENIRIAYTVKYLGSGRSFTPWVAFNTGSYLRSF